MQEPSSLEKTWTKGLKYEAAISLLLFGLPNQAPIMDINLMKALKWSKDCFLDIQSFDFCFSLKFILILFSF